MRIAVTGATGRVGARVVRLLSQPGEHEVTPLTRQRAPYDDIAALRTALSGNDALVFVSSDGEAARVVVHHQNVIRAAADAGVRHVVLLSSLDADIESPFCYAFTAGCTERMLRDSGMPFSIARASIFAEFFLGLLRRTVVDGTARLPAAGAGISLVSRVDIADCLAALARTGPSGRAHELTGPECLSADTIAARAGYRFRDVGPREFAAGLVRAGEDPWWVYAYATMFDSIRQQRWEAVTGEVRALIGRPPASLTEVLDRSATP